ncbi:MAG: alpha/beta fold hydrolase, partial [Candidatus Rokuibacteriota bacterium]
VVLAEIPGSPGAAPRTALFVPAPINDRLWHIPFNRVEKVPEQLVEGREDIFFGYEFAIQGGKLPDEVIKYYVRLVSNPDALRGSFGWYRAFDATLAQNEKRRTRRLKMPVLAIGGEASWGEHVGDAMKPLADDVQNVVIPGAGHWVAEEAPDRMLAALKSFLAAYREEAHKPGPDASRFAR